MSALEHDGVLTGMVSGFSSPLAFCMHCVYVGDMPDMIDVSVEHTKAHNFSQAMPV